MTQTQSRGKAGAPRRVVIHADEACLGNGQEPPTPGGAAGLLELMRERAELVRWDYFVCEPDTTNNRMALRSAIVALQFLTAGATTAGGSPLSIDFVTDSNYLVLGMREWVAAWRSRGWRRKGGAVENLDLWQELVALAERHEIRWTWVRGHAGQPKNEYANYLATRAAKEQRASGGLIGSGFDEWLRRQRDQGKYLDYDPDWQ